MTTRTAKTAVSQQNVPIKWFILIVLLAAIILFTVPRKATVSHAGQNIETYTYQLTQST
ncbi:MAG: hypothetical protein GY796_06660, partial [Chloroflexi bacterium]|nr:hypothetical protein [Chloroflexota bacterium]